MVVERGEEKERHAFDVKLAKEILPYAHAFLGVLPARIPREKGVKVRFVYPDSPASEAGIAAGDVIEKIGARVVDTIEDAQAALLPFEPQGTVHVVWRHDGAAKEADLKLESQPTDVPQSLDPAELPPADNESEEAIDTGLVELKIPEAPNTCHVWLPDTVKPGVPHGLLVWLGSPKEFDPQTLEREWGEFAARHHLIVMSPRPKDTRWASTDVEFIHKVVDEAVNRYPIDELRVAIGGVQSGGALSFLAAFPRRDRFHGVVTGDAPVPPRTTIPANEPTQRLAVFLLITEGARTTPIIERAAKAFRDAKYPVTVVKRNQTTAALTETQRAEVVRWIDTLDRL